MYWRLSEFVRGKIDRLVKMTSHLLDVKQAQQRLLEHFSRLEIETVSLHNAAGRVLYSDVQAAMKLSCI